VTKSGRGASAQYHIVEETIRLAAESK
jgi:hypothetical protein